MRIRVRLYAQLRDVAATDEQELELAQGATVSDLLETLYRQFPALRTMDGSILVAAGLEFVDRDHILQPEQEISIMPPLQGG